MLDPQYNEPKNGDCDWSDWYDAAGAKSYWKSGIYPYAETVIKEIRKYSDNLIVVGTPYYDQYVDAALVQPIDDTNVVYTFHYYAGEDPYRHKVEVLGKNPENMMKKGFSVFVTEWGNSAPSGDGGFTESYSAQWYNWMKSNQLSGANWSVSNKAETASYFQGGISGNTPAEQWSYTQSGEWTNKNVFASLPASYTKCVGAVVPSSSSSSLAGSSSSEVSSSSVQLASSSSSLASSSSNVNEKSSSSVASSSSVVVGELKITGSLIQTVAQGSSIETITFENVQSYSRDSWNLHFLTVPQQAENGKVVISGSIPEYIQPGKVSETLTINGQKVVIAFGVLPKDSEVPSSSSNTEESSSSSELPNAIVAQLQGSLKVMVSGRTLNIVGAAFADVDVFDLQGRPMARLKNVAGSADLSSIPCGNYIVRVHSGSMNLTQKVYVK